MKFARIALFICIACTPACGKKSALIAPEALVPAAVTDVVAEQRGGAVRLSWSAPHREVSGRPLQGVAAFRVYRRELLDPARDCESCPDAYTLLETVDVKPQLPAGRIFFTDPSVAEGKTYRYRVTAVSGDGAESPKGKVEDRKVVPPPPPPAAVSVMSAPPFLKVSWSAPGAAAGTVTGYAVYRRQETEAAFPPYPHAVAAAAADSFADDRAEPGAGYVYAVATRALVQGVAVEGGRSAEAKGRLLPP